MNIFKSWKTTLAGVVALASYFLPLFGIPLVVPPGVVETVLGVGLILAKDANVTGGSVDQEGVAKPIRGH